MAIIGISSIHLLRTFIEAGNLGTGRATFTEAGIMWQVITHAVFVLSAVGIAASTASASRRRNTDGAGHSLYRVDQR